MSRSTIRAVAELAHPAVLCDVSRPSRAVLWLQWTTLAWMLVECGIALHAAKTARSPALAAFGADSLIELLSATLVLLPLIPGVSIAERTASRVAAALLVLLATAVAATAIAALVFGWRPQASCSGIGITIAALLVMPLLAWLKRREAQRSGNRVLAADAVQSATCAYLALVTLAGLAINAVWHIAWSDAAAALIAVPLLAREARAAWRGDVCGCC